MAGRDWTINTLRTSVLSGETTAVDVCEDYLARIDSVDGDLNAFTAVLAESARRQAEQVDQHRDAWRDRPLLGVPVTIKDVICSKGEPTTGASRILEGFRSPYDATVVRKLRDAGAVIIGKTNCDEFAMGSSTEHSAYGVTRNPWGPHPHPRWIEWGRRGCCVGSSGPSLPRIRHRRLDTSAGGLLRGGGTQTNLRQSLAIRLARLRVVTGPDWPHDVNRPGCRHGVPGDRRRGRV